jgi:hypothetical protein
LEGLKLFVGIEPSDTAEDDALTEALDAAIAAQLQVCLLPCDPFGDRVYSDDLMLAVWLRAQRYVSRRSSPEGVVGLSGAGGDFVSARVPSYDVDVSHLEGPYRKIVVA